MLKYYNIKFCLVLAAVLLSTSIQTMSQQSIELDEIIFVHKDKTTFDDNVLNTVIAQSKVEYFKRKLMPEDILKLKKFYFDNGFFDVQVDTGTIYNAEDNTMIIKYSIKENSRYKVDNIIYKGLNNISETARGQLKNIITIKKNDYYNKVLVTQQTNEIADMLQNNGYMNANILPDEGTTITKNVSSPLVNITLDFEGADTIMHFGKTFVNIDSNKYNVSKDMIEQEIVYKEGDIYSKEKKLESERNISKIAIISNARIDLKQTTNDKADFTAEIQLSKKYEVTPYVKASQIENRFYYGGGAQIIDKYFLSGNRTLSFEGLGLFNSPSINRFEVSATLTQPHIFHRRATLTDKLTFAIYNEEKFRNYSLGNLSSINYFISEKTFYNNALLDINAELLRFHYDDSIAPLKLINTFLGLTLVHDNTNNAISPSGGYYHSILAGHGGLIAGLIINSIWKNYFFSKYWKLYTLDKFYFDISGKATSILATYFEIGDIIEYGSSPKQVPLRSIYKFFSGGSNSLRAWVPKENGVLKDKLEGGDFLLEGSLELRQKLFPSSDGLMKEIGGALFIDYGNVWENHKEFKASQIAYAVGFGLRYNLFLGPLRLDFAFKLYDPLDANGEKWLFSNVKRIFKDKFRIQFGIGEAF